MTEDSSKKLVFVRPFAVVTLVLVLVAGCSSKTEPGANVQPGGGNSSSSSGKTSPSPTATPLLSPFEDDPAVIALRAWAAQLAMTVNSGRTTDAALDALMMGKVRQNIQQIDGGLVGLTLPGALPFIPIQITKQTPTQHNVNICVISGGFAQDPKTHKPFSAHKVSPIDAGADLVNGQWIVSGYFDGKFSCAGVQIPIPT